MTGRSKIKTIVVALLIAALLYPVGIKIHNRISRAPKGMTHIAPLSGTRYHPYKNCRALKKANSISMIDLEAAEAKGLTLCSWCRKKQNGVLG